jgi:hypothetical protein
VSDNIAAAAFPAHPALHQQPQKTAARFQESPLSGNTQAACLYRPSSIPVLSWMLYLTLPMLFLTLPMLFLTLPPRKYFPPKFLFNSSTMVP